MWDIETTNLKADFGFLLCVGYKWLGDSKVYCPTIDLKSKKQGYFLKAEKQLVQEFYDVFCEADVIVTYNGKRFDVPYLQAKCYEHGIGTLPGTSHVDLYYTVKHNLAISRKSLQNAGYFLNLSAEKTPVEGRIWVAAMAGRHSALSYIVRHCKADVLVLEELYYKLRPSVRQHPRVRGWGPCRVCGSDRIQSRGMYITKLKGNRRRIRCQDCGTWEDRPENKEIPSRTSSQRRGKKQRKVAIERGRPASARARIKEFEAKGGRK